MYTNDNKEIKRKILLFLQNEKKPLNVLIKEFGKDVIGILKELKNQNLVKLYKLPNGTVICDPIHKVSKKTLSIKETNEYKYRDEDIAIVVRDVEFKEDKLKEEKNEFEIYLESQSKQFKTVPIYDKILNESDGTNGYLWRPINIKKITKDNLQTLRLDELIYQEGDNYYLVPTFYIWRRNFNLLVLKEMEDERYDQMLVDLFFALYKHPRIIPDFTDEEEEYINGLIGLTGLEDEEDIDGLKIFTITGAIKNAYEYKEDKNVILSKKLIECEENCSEQLDTVKSSLKNISKILVNHLKGKNILIKKFEKHISIIKHLLAVISPHVNNLSDFSQRQTILKHSTDRKDVTQIKDKKERQEEISILAAYDKEAKFIYDQIKLMMKVLTAMFQGILAPIKAIPPNRRNEEEENFRILNERVWNQLLQLCGNIERGVSSLKSHSNILAATVMELALEENEVALEKKNHDSRRSEGKLDHLTKEIVLSCIESFMKPLVQNYSSFNWKYDKINIRNMHKRTFAWGDVINMINIIKNEEPKIIEKIIFLNNRERISIKNQNPILIYIMPFDHQSYATVNDNVILFSKIDKSFKKAFHQAVVFYDKSIKTELKKFIPTALDGERENFQIFQIFSTLYKKYVEQKMSIKPGIGMDYPSDFKNKEIFNWFVDSFDLK